jgi:TatD DNase family protein
MSFLIDTHAHIYDDSFDGDRETVFQTAIEKGIKQVWMPNCNSETIPRMYAVEQINPKAYLPMMGLHPCYVDANYSKELDIVKKELESRKFCMIGEIGLDFYWDLSHVKQQELALLEQLALARTYNLPICIHSRSSKDGSLNAIMRCVELIKENEFTDIIGIFHCFSGNYEDANAVLEIGFKLGIGGVATFKNGGLDTFLKKIPLGNIVLETDSPYLAPVPFRGKRNEVAYLDLVAQKVADIYEISKETLIETTYTTAQDLIKNYSKNG